MRNVTWPKICVIATLLVASPAAMANATRTTPPEAHLKPAPTTPARPVPQNFLAHAKASDMVTPDRSVGAPKTNPTERPLAAMPARDLIWHDVTVVKVLPKGAQKTDARSTNDQIRAVITKVDTFYRDVTEGKVRFRVAKIHNWVDMPDISCHNYYPMMRRAIRAAHWERRTNQHVVLWTPTRSACPNSGRGELSAHMHEGGTSYVAGPTFFSGTVAHELGHNLGLSHSGGIYCKPGTVDDRFDGHRFTGNNGCLLREYGDWYDIMGMAATTEASWGTLAPRHRRILGLNKTAPPVARNSQFFRIPVAHIADRGAARFPVIVAPDGAHYSLEYRTPAGQNTFLNRLAVKRGVLIRRTLHAAPNQGHRTFGARSLLLQASRHFDKPAKNIRTAFLTTDMPALPLGTGAVTAQVLTMDDKAAVVQVVFNGVPPNPDSDPRKAAAAKAVKLTTVRKAQPNSVGVSRKRAASVRVGAEPSANPAGGTKRAVPLR